jgi:hypothetical protein
MKVLARKPAPKRIAKRDPVTGMASLQLEDSDEEGDGKPKETPAQIRARQQRELGERQRRYDEARAKIFGDTGAVGNGRGGSGKSSGASTPGSVTPPRTAEGRRGRGGRGRGGHRGHDRGGFGGDHQRTGSNPARREQEGELYDPNYSAKPGFNLERRGGGAPLTGTGRSTPRLDDQIIRSPRGPDASGRGGAGFGRRGAKEG